MGVGDHAEFNLFKASKFPSISIQCHRIEVIDNLVREEVTNHVSGDPFEHCMLNDGTSKDENLKVFMCAHFLKAFQQVPKVEELTCDKPSFDEDHASKVELKPLPSSF